MTSELTGDSFDKQDSIAMSHNKMRCRFLKMGIEKLP